MKRLLDNEFVVAMILLLVMMALYSVGYLIYWGHLPDVY